MPKIAVNAGSNTKYAIAKPEELRRLLDAAKERSEEHWAVVTILVRTGMHLSVLTRLGPDNIAGDVLRWQRTKKAPFWVCRTCRRKWSPRGGPRPERCHRCGGEWVLTTHPGRMCELRLEAPDLRDALTFFLACRRKSVDWYDQLVKEAAADAGMPQVSSLSLRKTRAYHLKMKGLTDAQVARALGCSVRLVQDVYALEQTADLVDRVADADRAEDPTPPPQG